MSKKNRKSLESDIKNKKIKILDDNFEDDDDEIPEYGNNFPVNSEKINSENMEFISSSNESNQNSKNDQKNTQYETQENEDEYPYEAEDVESNQNSKNDQKNIQYETQENEDEYPYEAEDVESDQEGEEEGEYIYEGPSENTEKEEEYINDEPRNLTDEEIDFIFEDFPKIMAGFKDIAEKIRDEIINVNKLCLRDYKICPSMIIPLKRSIFHHFRRSVVEPGHPVGLLTGEALGSSSTQQVLNTFHQSGAKQSVGTGTTGELLNATQFRKTESTIVHFKNKSYSTEDIINYEKDLIGVTIYMLCTHTKIIKYENHNKEWWYNFYDKWIEKKSYRSNHFLRLYFNTNMLYKYRVTLLDVVKKLENNGGSTKTLVCVPSPINYGIIDIYPIKNLMNKVLKENIDKEDKEDSGGAINSKNSAVLFLDMCVKPNLSNIIIKGVAGIKKLFTISTPTITIINSAELANIPANSDESTGNRVWTIWLDLIKIRNTCIPVQKLINFFHEIGCEIKNLAPKKTYLNAFDKADKEHDEDLLIVRKGQKQNYIELILPNLWDLKENFSSPMSYLSSNEKNEDDLIYIKLVKPLDSETKEEIEESDSFSEGGSTKKVYSSWVFYLNIEYEKEFTEKSFKTVLKLLETNKINVISPEVLNYKKKIISFNSIKGITKISVTMPDGWQLDKHKDPESFFKYIIEKEEELANIFTREEKLKGVIYPIYNYSKAYREGIYNHAELMGSNLKTLLSLKIIDSSKTISNSPHDILNCFGIESARNFIAHNFYDLIVSSDSYVNYRYTEFVADFMTSLGVIIAITSKGVVKHNRGCLADATFGEPLTRFISSALIGGKENVSSTSAAIFTGVRMKLGTGYPEFSLNNSVIDRLKGIDISDLFIKGLKDMKEDEDFSYSESKIVFGDEDVTDIFSDVDFSKINFIAKDAKDIIKKHLNEVLENKGAPKGPIPQTPRVFEIPLFLQNIVKNTVVKEEEVLPPLSISNIDEVIKRAEKESIKAEKVVKFIDSGLVINNIKKYL